MRASRGVVQWRPGEYHPSTMAMFAAWEEACPALHDLAEAADEAMPLADVELLAPLLYPGCIYCAGANYKKHAMEMSPHPEKALKAGDTLANLVPDAGHLRHMPTHIDVLCGHYENVVSRNHTAIIADREFLAHAGPMNFYSAYRCHDYHFKIYGAMFLGQFKEALCQGETGLDRHFVASEALTERLDHAVGAAINRYGRGLLRVLSRGGV